MSDLIWISYIKLNGKVKDNYTKSKKGWIGKHSEWKKLKNVLSNSNIQFSPYSFRNGYKTNNNWSNDNQNMLVFDIDDTISIAEAQKMFKSYKYLIGTTKSHQKDKKGVVCDRYRLCLPAINIPRDKYTYFKMLSIIVPFNDEQTEHGTGAFLGNDDAIIIYNDGKMIDCHKASIAAEKQLHEEKMDKVKVDRDLMSSYSNNKIADIKDSLTFEIVVDILESVGYEVTKNKFRLRDEENTASANISYKTLSIKDFGGDFKGDIFDILVEHQGMSFGDSIRYVSNFV